MRKIVGPVLLFLGAFLVAIGLLSKFYMGNALLKTPINVDEVIHLDGTAQLPNAQGEVESQPVIATSSYLSNSQLSDSSVASFENAQCVVLDVGNPVGCPPADDPQGRLLSATTDNFATDRRTAEAVNDPAHLPPGSIQHEGLINKWPFLAEKKTYTYWDDGTQQGVLHRRALGGRGLGRAVHAGLHVRDRRLEAVGRRRRSRGQAVGVKLHGL